VGRGGPGGSAVLRSREARTALKQIPRVAKIQTAEQRAVVRANKESGSRSRLVGSRKRRESDRDVVPIVSGSSEEVTADWLSLASSSALAISCPGSSPDLRRPQGGLTTAESDGGRKMRPRWLSPIGADFSENRDLSTVPGREASPQTGLR